MPASSLRTRDVLLGFADSREEVAFQISKAQQLERRDVWTASMIATSVLIGAPAAFVAVLGAGDSHGKPFLACAALWWMWVMLPGALHYVARPFYVSHRGLVWGACLLLSGLSAAVTGEVVVPRASYIALQKALIARVSPLAVVEFVIRPALLRLSVGHQLLASIGGALATFYVSQGPSDGPFSLAACLAMGAGALVMAALLDARARRTWLLAQRTAALALPAAGAGPGPAAGASCTSTGAGL